jgi:hypothetical protein
MKVYVFGNPDVNIDSVAIKAASCLKNKIPQVNFVFVTPNTDLSFSGSHPVILDTVSGIKKVTVINDLDSFVLPPRSTVHDFDLGFQLKYLKKLGKLNKITIIGLPQTGKINYRRIQSILRKLVAQDMQGS